MNNWRAHYETTARMGASLAADPARPPSAAGSSAQEQKLLRASVRGE